MDQTIEEDLREFYACWRETNDLYSRWAAKWGLSPYELYVLYELNEKDPECTQKKICDRWYLTKQTVNGILKGMEQEGLVCYRVLEKDKRNKAVLLTESGLEYVGRVIGTLRELEERVMRQLGPEKRRAMNTGTRLFCEYFIEVEKGAGDE